MATKHHVRYDGLTLVVLISCLCHSLSLSLYLQEYFPSSKMTRNSQLNVWRVSGKHWVWAFHISRKHVRLMSKIYGTCLIGGKHQKNSKFNANICICILRLKMCLMRIYLRFKLKQNLRLFLHIVQVGLFKNYFEP